MSKSLVLQLTKVVFKARLFWPIWIATTVTAAALAARLTGQTAALAVRGEGKGSTTRTLQQAWPRSAVLALALLAIFLVGYIALILKWEDFAYLDNSLFTLGFLRGHDFGPPIWREYGRFFPLGHQEFDVIHHFTSTVVGYYVFPIIQLLALCGILLVLDDELGATARVGLTGLVLVSPAIVASFGGLIYTERNVVLWLACLALSIKRFDKMHAATWAIFATVCAQFMIYYKETAFLLLWGLAVGRLLLRSRNRDQRGSDGARLRKKEDRLDLCLASLGAIFLLYYVTSMLPHPNMQYAYDQRFGVGQAVVSYLKLDLGAWLLVALALGRAYMILRGRVPASPLWDGLALGSVACFAAYLYLGMFSAYYLAPVDLIAVLYVGRFTILSWRSRGWETKAAIVGLLGAALVQDVTLSAFRVYERKNVIHGKAEIARVVKAQSQDDIRNAQRLFFPFASPYSVMEFASYLSYRGVKVEGVPAESAGLGSVVLVTRSSSNDGPCVEYEKIVCHAGNSPDRGDLVIVLPDDDASLADAIPYLERSEALLSYDPRPRIPRSLGPLVRNLHVASYAFAQKKLPDRWLHASVTRW